MSVVEDLKVARDRVERGWRQGDYGDFLTEDGNVCALGALRYAVQGENGYLDPEAFAAYCAMSDRLRNYIPDKYASIPAFNDASTTRKEDVLALFEKALADLGGLG